MSAYHWCALLRALQAFILKALSLQALTLDPVLEKAEHKAYVPLPAVPHTARQRSKVGEKE